MIETHQERWLRIDREINKSINGSKLGTLEAVDIIVSKIGKATKVDRTYYIRNLTTRAMKCGQFCRKLQEYE